MSLKIVARGCLALTTLIALISFFTIFSIFAIGAIKIARNVFP